MGSIVKKVWRKWS